MGLARIAILVPTRGRPEGLEALARQLQVGCARPEDIQGKDKLERNLQLMRQRVAEEPEDMDGLYLLGRELVYSGAAEEGLATLLRFEERMTAQGRREQLFRLTHYLQAAALERLGRLDEAVEALERGLALDPDFPSTHYALGELRRQQGRLDEAIEAYTRALEGQRYHERHPLTTYNAITMAHCGSQAEQRREWCAAKALGHEPPPRPELEAPDLKAIQAAMDALGQGLLDEAERQLLLATRLNPAHPQVAYLQAELAYRQGDLEEAIACCFSALKLGTGQPVVWALMGLLLHEDQDSPLAAFFLQQALRLAPGYAKAQALLRQAQQAPRQGLHHPELLAWLEGLQRQGQAQAAQAAKAKAPPLKAPPRR